MTPLTQQEHFLAMVCNQRPDAVSYLKCWGDYLRAVDNIVDDNLWDAEHLREMFFLGAQCFSHPFYQSNKAHLQMTVVILSSLWVDSCHWERSQELWKRQWADVLRHADGQMVSAVAMICGGWEHLRKISAPFMAACYIEHKDRHGVPA